MTMTRTYYAYLHCRPDGSPFYVGKGHGRRMHNLTDRTVWHKHVTTKYGAHNILIGKLDCSSEEIAFELEKGLIKCLRRMGHALVNLTEGGDGASGYVPTAETRARIAEAGRGRKASAETRAKRSATRKAQMLADPSIANNMSAKLKGRKFSEETLARMRDSQRRSYATNPERGARIAAGNRGRTQSEESNQKRASTLRAFWATEEGKQKLAQRPKRAMSAETKAKIAAKALARHLANPDVLLMMSRKASKR